MADVSYDELTTAYLEHQRLVSLINSMVDAVIAVDDRIRIATYNGAALNILDINEAITNKRLNQVCQLIDKNNQPVDIVDLVKDTKLASVHRDLRLQYADKSSISLYLSIAPVHAGYGKSGKLGYVILMRDISHEKSLEEERDEFISVVSHELRTPVAIAEGNISNAVYIMEKGGSMDEIQAALKQAHDQTLFLSSMINDLATLSRAERGKLKVEVDPINIHELVTNVAADYVPEMKKKGLTIHLHLSPDLELLKSSKLYVREILQNFITNAIKYTEKGSITISAKLKDKGVSISIEDTGIGISIRDQEKIFDKFFRSEDFRTRQNNGTGLGLYVTMKLARLIHADIATKSELNKGSCFTIYFPNLK
jgi:signal transduction histidine kinase